MTNPLTRHAAGLFVCTSLVACSGGGSSSPAPKVVSASAVALPGADNDFIAVVFDRKLKEAQAEDVANWTVESPLGTPFDLTNATVDYDPNTSTATVTLGAGTVGSAGFGNDLQTRDSILIDWAGVKGLNGTPVRVTVAAAVTGDSVPPKVLGAYADDLGTTVTLRFSEAAREVFYVNLYNGLPGDPGPRFILTDADGIPAVASTGSVTLSAQPADADTVTIDDGTQTVVFEFDSDLSVVQTPTLRQVVIDVDVNTTTGNLAAAINDPGFTLDVTAGAAAAVCNLTHDVAGTAGNNAVLASGANLAVSGLSGGAAAMATTEDPLGPGYSWSLDDEGLVVDFTPTVPSSAADTIQIYGLRDLAGNAAFPEAGLALDAQDLSVPTLNTGASTLNVVSGESNDTIVVEFDSDMSATHVLEPANYSAAPLDLTGASFAFDGDQIVTITLPAGENIQVGTSHDLTLVHNAGTPLTTAQGVPIAIDEVEAVNASGDSTAILQAQTSAFVGDLANPATAVLVFPEAVDTAGSAVLTNYDILGVNPTAVALVTPRTVRLTFAAQPVASDVLNVQPAAATDLGGTPAAGVISIALGAADTTPPAATVSATAAEGRGGDTLTVTFDEPVELAQALSLSSYAFTQDAAPIDLTGATAKHESGSNTVRFALPEGLELTFGAAVAVTISGVADVSGNPLAVQPTGVAVGGDGSSPDFDGDAFVNWIVDLSGQTVDVLFDEDVDQTFVETPGNWSTDLFTPISAVQLIAPDIARVSTSGAIAAGELLQLSGLPDLAGNTSGAISVDPQE